MTEIIYNLKIINNENVNKEIVKILKELKYELYPKLGEDCNLKILNKIEELEIILQRYRRIKNQ
jgi:hypothetical protein